MTSFWLRSVLISHLYIQCGGGGGDGGGGGGGGMCGGGIVCINEQCFCFVTSYLDYVVLCCVVFCCIYVFCTR